VVSASMFSLHASQVCQSCVVLAACLPAAWAKCGCSVHSCKTSLASMCTLRRLVCVQCAAAAGKPGRQACKQKKAQWQPQLTSSRTRVLKQQLLRWRLQLLKMQVAREGMQWQLSQLVPNLTAKPQAVMELLPKVGCLPLSAKAGLSLLHMHP
jgi:hypothetical protein